MRPRFEDEPNDAAWADDDEDFSDVPVMEETGDPWAEDYTEWAANAW